MRISSPAFPAANDPEFTQTGAELVQTTLRHVIWATALVYGLWHFVGTITWPRTLGVSLWAPTLLLGLTTWLALHALKERPTNAQIIWLIGVFGTVTLALSMHRTPELVFLYVLLPLMAAITSSWVPAIATWALVILWCLIMRPILPAAGIPSAYVIATIFGATLTALIGLAASQSLFTVTYWSYYHFKEARRNMADAREHRAQLGAVVKDLDQAYHRLERANASLVAAWRTADEAQRFRAEFAANVSHELRTPLNLIIGFSEMMIMSPESYGGAELPGRYRADLNTVYQNARHLLALVDDVLDLARIEAGKIALVRDQVALPELMRDAAAMVSDYITAKGLTLTWEVAEDLPSVWIDRLRVRQVLLNLMVNAARFTKRGGLTVRARLNEDHVRVEVVDTGQGIPSQDVPKIFEEFRTTEQPTSTWHSGTGLGLPISRRFIALHGGDMGVESVYGQGSTFWFTLPIVPAVALASTGAGDDAPELERSSALPMVGGRQRLAVVLAESADMADALQRHVGGLQLVGATTPSEAERLVDELRALAIIVESSQPQHAWSTDVPVIRCALPDRHRKAITLGVDDLLIKPVSRGQLLAALNGLDLGEPIERVVIADDDADLVRMFSRMLEGRVTERLEAFNGAEALALIREKEPDLVLLDMLMPQMNGQDVIDHLAADPATAEIPVLMVTARGQDHTWWQLPAELRMTRRDGLELGELVRVLEGVVGALSPGWSE